MPSETTLQVLQSMATGLTPMDRAIFIEAATVVAGLSPLELNRFVQDSSRFPALDTGIENVNTRLGVYARQVSIELASMAEIDPANDPKGEAADKKKISDSEAESIKNTNIAMRQVEETLGGERREISNHLKEARKRLSLAEISVQNVSANPGLGTAVQKAAKDELTIAKNAVRNTERADIEAQQKYTAAMRSFMPGREGNNDPLGLAPKDPEAAAKPPPI